MKLPTHMAMLSVLIIIAPSLYAMQSLISLTQFEDTAMQTTMACGPFTIIDDYIPTHRRFDHVLDAFAQPSLPVPEKKADATTPNATIPTPPCIPVIQNAAQHHTNIPQAVRAPVARMLAITYVPQEVPNPTPVPMLPYFYRNLLMFACAQQQKARIYTPVPTPQRTSQKNSPVLLLTYVPEEIDKPTPVATTQRTPQKNSPLLPLSKVHSRSQEKKENPALSVTTPKKTSRPFHFSCCGKQEVADDHVDPH